jgi:hypothetical protein
MKTSTLRLALPLLFAAASLAPRIALAQDSDGPAPIASPPPPPADDDWNMRDRQLNEPSSINGGVGLLHTQHAQGNAPGQFTLAFTTEYFSAGFLCSQQFPCPNPNGGSQITSDTLNHIGGSLNLTVSITKWLEAYAGTSAIANSDSANRPSLLQVLGDSDLGLKGHVALNKWLHVGGAAELWLINGTGAVGLDGRSSRHR